MNHKEVSVALDAMGGDFGPNVVVPAALLALKENPFLKITLVGDETIISPLLKSNAYPEHRLKIVHTDEYVSMDDSPASALRNKRRSSIRIAAELVRDKECMAMVSSGNTGALMAVAKFILRTISGIDRPAIMYSLPSKLADFYMLDLGANVDCAPEHLLQFAIMGSVFMEAVTDKKQPKVALLNIGMEAIKGSEQVKNAAALLQTAHDNGIINYIGFVEGDTIYEGVADVVVCDGFIGNVALKASEGVAKMMTSYAKAEFTRTWYAKLSALLSMSVLKKIKTRFDLNHYNGANLLGLAGVVIKSHGGANVSSFKRAIDNAYIAALQEVPKMIAENVVARLEKLKTA